LEGLAGEMISGQYSAVPHMIGPPYEDLKYLPELYQPPGYPTLLAGAKYVMWVVGPRGASWVGGTDVSFMMLSFQMLLDLHLIGLVFVLGRTVGTYFTGLLSAALQAVSPLAASASLCMLPDSIVAFLLTIGVLLLVWHFRTGSRLLVILGGCVMSAICYFSALGAAFSAVMVVLLALRKQGFSLAMAFLGIVSTCLAPWVVRNAIVADYWGFSSAITENAYWYSAAAVAATRMDVGVEEIRSEFRRAEGWDRFRQGGMSVSGQKPEGLACFGTAGELTEYRWRTAKNILVDHPLTSLCIHLSRDLSFWGCAYIGDNWGSDRTPNVVDEGQDMRLLVLVRAMCVGMTAVAYFGLVLCWILRLRSKWRSTGWLCVLLVVVAVVLPGAANSPRFRVPVEPILSVAAAIGWLGLIHWFRRRRAGRDGQTKATTGETE